MLVVWQLGWVEIDLGYYTTCLGLLGLLGLCLNGLSKWAEWWNLKI